MKLLAAGSGALCVILAFTIAWSGPRPRFADDLPAGGALSADELARASQIIDQLVDADLLRSGVRPNAPASDEIFLRRAYLVIIGRIPTADEALAFLASAAANKRAVLIDRLLASEGRVLGEFNYWADLLRVSSVLGGQRYPGQPWIDWIKQSLRENKPYDRFVSEQLTANGAALAKGNGATGFYLRDAGMPLDHAATTASIFLATQIGCAQCHDHPFDVWKQRQFYELAAYTAGSDAKRDPPGGKEFIRAFRAKEGELQPELKRTLQRLGQTLWVRVNGTTKSTLNLPDDYQYADAKPKSTVSAAPIFGSAPVQPKQDPRLAFARWMTSPENPRFTLAIANRQWKRAFGLGLIEPADNLSDTSVPVNPELMEFLTRLMIALKYDLRAFQAILYKSQAWQRQATTVELKPGESYHFQGPLPRRLSAEQAWDSLLTLGIPDLDERTGPDASAMVAFYEKYKDLDPDGYITLAKGMAKARAEGERLKLEIQSVRQALQTAKGEELKKLRERQQQLAQRRDELLQQADLMNYRPLAGKKNGSPQFLRAAELPQPAPDGHFLRVFGQADREVIDNATANPAVTQALFLLNGPVDAELAKPNSLLSSTLAKGTDDLSRIRGAYLAILSRQPKAQELVTASAYLRSTPNGGLHDLCWALINSTEFIFLP